MIDRKVLYTILHHSVYSYFFKWYLDQYSEWARDSWDWLMNAYM